MRVKGNTPPGAYVVEADVYRPGYLCVRLYDNVEPYADTDEDGQARSGWTYDEYALSALNRAGIAEEIEADTAAWLEAARTAEYERLDAALRAERQKALTACDYTNSADYPASDTERQGWLAYRQAWRDMTEQPGYPYTFERPTPPARDKSTDTIIGVIDAMIGSGEGDGA